MIKRSPLLAFFPVMLCINTVNAQLLDRSVISTSGESSSVSNISLTYTIGESVTEFFQNASAGKIITAGFIQGDQVINLPFAIVTRELAIFPNPTAGDNAKLDLRNMPNGTYTVELCDLIGKILFSKTIQYTKDFSLNLDLDISRYKGGTYYIRVRNELAKGTVKLVKL